MSEDKQFLLFHFSKKARDRENAWSPPQAALPVSAACAGAGGVCPWILLHGEMETERRHGARPKQCGRGS